MKSTKSRIAVSLLPFLIAACGGSADGVSLPDDSGSTSPTNDGPAPVEDAASPHVDATSPPSAPDGSSDASNGDSAIPDAEPGDSAEPTRDAEAGIETDASPGDAADAATPSDAGVPDATLPPPIDAGSGADAAGPGDASPPTDAEPPIIDAAPPLTDAEPPTEDGAAPVIDAASPVDAAPPTVDAAPPVIDAAPPFDAAPPPDVDANAPDGGCVIPSSAWTAPPPAAPPLPPETPPTKDTVITVPLPVNDIIYDPYTKLLYASVPSSDGAQGNSIARIDPTTGAVLGFVYVGSEPGALALSSNGEFLYVVLDGAEAIRRYTIATQSADLQFPVLINPNQDDPVPRSLSVLPNSPHTVVAASGTDEGYYDMVAMYDDGVPRAATLTTAIGYQVFPSGSDALAFMPLDGAIQVLCLDAAGVSLASTIYPPGAVPYLAPHSSFTYLSGLAYEANGQVPNLLQNGLLTGTYGTQGSFVVEPAVHRVYFLNPNIQEITAYDQDHFTPLGSTTFTGVMPDESRRLVRWGRYGFAFTDVGSVLSIVRTTLVPSQP